MPLKQKEPDTKPAEVRRLTPLQFECVCPLLNAMDPKRVEMGWMHLVQGKTLSEVSKEYGCSRQNVYAAVEIIWRVWTHRQESLRIEAAGGQGLPAGWTYAILAGPTEIVAGWQAQAEQVKKDVT